MCLVSIVCSTLISTTVLVKPDRRSRRMRLSRELIRRERWPRGRLREYQQLRKRD
ncbi:MAG TPA: hypothetical protein VFR69_11440 [Rubrobacteraceae bacterium]|nr:hypothetical protein [Rubrobacteraceae bacterium]